MLSPKLFGLVAQFCTKVSKAFWSKLIALLRYLFDNLFKLITIILIVLFIFGIKGRFDGRIVSLEPITVPPKYMEKYGISEQSLTNLLIDKLSFIDTNVATRRSGYKFTFVSSVKESEITFKYQETSIPLNLLYSFFLRDVLRIEHKVINGSVIEVGGEIWVVIRLVGKPGKSFCLSGGKFKDIERKCTEIAEYCYKQVDPYRIALYYFQKHRDCIVKNGKKTMSVEDVEKLLALYKNLEKSKKQTDDIIEKRPKDFWALNLKGLIFLELADLADHRKLNNKVIEKCHTDALDFFADSIGMAEKAKIRFPSAHTGKGHVYYAQKNFIKSFSKYNEAIEEGENDVRAYLGKANSFLLFFLENYNKKIQYEKIPQGKFLIQKNNFFFDDYKSSQEILNNSIQTQKYAIDFYNDAKEQFLKVGQERSRVTKSLDQLKKIVKILKKGEGIDNKIKDELKESIECLNTNNPI